MHRSVRIASSLVVLISSVRLVMAADNLPAPAPCGANGAAAMSAPVVPPACSCNGDAVVQSPPYVFTPPNPTTPELNVGFSYDWPALALFNRLEGIDPQTKKWRPHLVRIDYRFVCSSGETKVGYFEWKTEEALYHRPSLGFYNIEPGRWFGEAWLSFDGRKIMAGKLLEEPEYIGPGSGDHEAFIRLDLYRRPKKN